MWLFCMQMINIMLLFLLFLFAVYAVFVLICLACFIMCIFLCCMLFYCFDIDVSVFIFGKKLCRAYVIMLYTCRIKIKFCLSYLILCYVISIFYPSSGRDSIICHNPSFTIENF